MPKTDIIQETMAEPDTTPRTSIRSQDEILAELERVQKNDFFGFKSNDLLGYLDYDHAKEYLKPEVTAEEWKASPSDRASILKEMEDYMPFAWDKANNGRGLSAGRSLAHYTVWVWMLGDQDQFGDLETYQHYGKDNLRQLCKLYGWDADKWDDGRRVNS